MYRQITHLKSISDKAEKTIIGLMSGTSLDGLDIALCKIKGDGRSTEIEVAEFISIPYSDEFRKEVQKIFSIENVNLPLLTMLHTYIGDYHAELILESLKVWHIDTKEIDLIASHGQTIYHAPHHLHQSSKYGNATLQIGDGDHIAVKTGILTISDFRLKHIAAGGEGAPLAVYGDYFLFSDKTENRVLLNIGGIANYTWLPNNYLENKLPCLSTDVGPGNGMMDMYVQKYFPELTFDVDGKLAANGKICDDLLLNLLKDDFFSLNLPKTIGPELFNLSYLDRALYKVSKSLSHEDIMATLNMFTSTCITNTIINHLKSDIEFTLYLSGGGSHNITLIQNLQNQLPNIKIEKMQSLGIHGDAKEAVLFAVLANECVSGKPSTAFGNMKGVPDVSMGKISLPK